MKSVLHVGCGPKRIVGGIAVFPGDAWRETRLDIEPAVQPDVVASMTDMAAVPDSAHDAVYSSHNLEHLFPHELHLALAEFRRVLRPGGFLLALVPDIQRAAAAIAAGRLDLPLYATEEGPIYPLEVLYGHQRSIARGQVHMAHRNGFTQASLAAALDQAGFVAIQVKRKRFDLLAMAYEGHCPPGSPRLAQDVAPGRSTT